MAGTSVFSTFTNRDSESVPAVDPLARTHAVSARADAPAMAVIAPRLQSRAVVSFMIPP